MRGLASGHRQFGAIVLFCAVCLLVPARAGLAVEPQNVQARGGLATLVGSGTLATLPGEVERVALADESIARVQIISDREVLLTGLRPGRTTVFVWLNDGRRFRYLLQVTRDLGLLKKSLQDLDPGIAVEVSPDSSVAVLRGDVADKDMAREAEKRASAFLQSSGGGGPSEILNLLRYPGSASGIDQALAETLKSVDPRIRVRRIQVGEEPDTEKDTFVLEGRVRTVPDLVQAVVLAERQLGGTGNKVKAADDDQLQFQRTQGFIGGGFGGGGAGAGGSGGGNVVAAALQGAPPAKSGLAAQLARSLLITSESGRVISFLEVDNLYQVLVSIKVMEVNRTRAKKVGVNYRISGDGWAIGSFTGPQSEIGGGGGAQPGGVAEITGISGTANLVGAFVNDTLSILAAVDFLEEKSLARAVAEPNILTLSGEHATVLVGGEIPIPTNAVTNVAAVQGVFFQDFGIRLDIRPTVDRDGVIALEASPSIVSPAPGLGVGNIPGFTIKRVQTIARVAAGHSLVIGGLLTFEEGMTQNRIPGLGSIPILKSLFSWKRKNRDEKELLFIISPRIIEVGEKDDVEGVVEQVDPDTIELPELEWEADRARWKQTFDPKSLRTDGVFTRWVKEETCGSFDTELTWTDSGIVQTLTIPGMEEGEKWEYIAPETGGKLEAFCTKEGVRLDINGETWRYYSPQEGTTVAGEDAGAAYIIGEQGALAIHVEENEVPVEPIVETPISEGLAVDSAFGTYVVGSEVNPCLNVRPQPRVWSDSFDCLQPGSRVEVIGADDGWFKILLPGGSEGWVASTYLEFLE